jgi:hypothetical protein
VAQELHVLATDGAAIALVARNCSAGQFRAGLCGGGSLENFKQVHWLEALKQDDNFALSQFGNSAPLADRALRAAHAGPVVPA